MRITKSQRCSALFREWVTSTKATMKWVLFGCFLECRWQFSLASYLSLVPQVLVYSSQSGAGQLLRMMPTTKKTGVTII